MRNLFIVLSLLLLTACSPSKYVTERTDPNSAMIYGYISASKGPMWYGWVQLQHTDKEGNKAYYRTRTDDDGMFYAENLPLGHYQIFRIGRGNQPVGPNGLSGTGIVWKLGDEGGKSTAIKIKKPGAHYIGSFKYVYDEGKAFVRRESFDLIKVDTPKESELLERLVKYTKDTQWQEGIKQRQIKVKK